MTATNELNDRIRATLGADIPAPILYVLRGVGQVFFQENALSGACFVLGIAFGSPVMAIGALVGAAIGTVTAWLLKFDESELRAGIYGFNSALVGIAVPFFFRIGVASIALLIVGCIAAAAITYLVRRHVPFPTYTAPFIVTTWVLFFLGPALGAVRPEPGPALEGVGLAHAVAHGVSQVMFQASLWTALLFIIGIGVSDWKHAAWVVAGALIGALVGSYHATVAIRAFDPESLIERTLLDNVELGLYGYNATLAAVALFLWRRSLIPPLLGILLSVPITEMLP